MPQSTSTDVPTPAIDPEDTEAVSNDDLRRKFARAQIRIDDQEINAQNRANRVVHGSQVDARKEAVRRSGRIERFTARYLATAITEGIDEARAVPAFNLPRILARCCSSRQVVARLGS